MLGVGMGTLHVDLFVAGTWQEDVLPPVSGDQGDVWHEHSLDLSAYSGMIQVRFRALTGPSYTSDIAIDDFHIIDP